LPYWFEGKTISQQTKETGGPKPTENKKKGKSYPVNDS